MTLNVGERVWQWIAGILAAIMVTGIVSWWSFGGGVSKAELDAAVANHITRAEMNMLMDRIEEMAKDIREIRAALAVNQNH